MKKKKTNEEEDRAIKCAPAAQHLLPQRLQEL
jgi:hypothetical protein